MVEEFNSEVVRRRRVVELVSGGMSKAAAARQVGRTRRWAVKWVGRWRSDGEGGLVDQPRTPHRQPTKTPQAVVDKVLEIREELEADPVASIGALTILATMERERFTPIPSVASIERILSRAGRTRRVSRKRRSGVSLPLPHVTFPGVWQQADWIQNRYLEGGIGFNSLQVGDVGSHGIASGQYLDRKLLTAVTFVIEHAWPTLSIPLAMGTDNAFASTTHPNNPFTAWVRTCLYFGVEVIVGPPGGLGWTNDIEAVNNLWQQRTIWTRHFASLDDLRAGSNQACQWFNQSRPILDPDTCGTRYPAEYIANNTDALRWLPPITIADHLNHRGRLVLPITQGRITFIRHVTEHHTINVAGIDWPVPETIPMGGLVTATITTTDHTLTIRHKGEPAATHRYPIPHRIIDPYYPPAQHSLVHHV